MNTQQRAAFIRGEDGDTTPINTTTPKLVLIRQHPRIDGSSYHSAIDVVSINQAVGMVKTDSRLTSHRSSLTGAWVLDMSTVPPTIISVLK